jgi:hypothetical protein
MAIDPSDPYFLQHGALAKQLQALINQYGDSFALTPQYQQEFGLGAGDVSTATGNPYSTLAQLRQQLTTNQGQIQNTANSHGALYSGANAAATQHEIQAAGQRNYNAQQQLQAQLSGLQTTDLGNLTDATARAAAAALNDQTLAPAPAAAPAAATGPTVYGSPTQQAVPVSAPYGFSPLAPQNQQATPLPKIAKPPKPPAIGIPHA